MASYSNPHGKKNIFISYRVQDTAGETGRLVDSLKQYFDADQIFMDIEKLEPGADFTQAIARSLECCDVLLAVIGPNWSGKNTDGTSRIMNENDWVRLELATALKRNIRVVPVLVDGGKLPAENELPPELISLVNRQAHEITNKRWKYDTDQLVLFLKNVMGISFRQKDFGNIRKSNTPWTLIAVIGSGVALLLILLFNMQNNQSQKREPAWERNPSVLENTPVDNGNNQQTMTEIIDGTWIDANSVYYLTITQDGSQVNVSSFSMAGVNTGQGTGTVNGKQVTFQIDVTNFGLISYNAAVTAAGKITGTMSYNNNGITGSEGVNLIKR